MARLWWGLLSVTLVGVTASFLWRSHPEGTGPELPVLGRVRDFTLRDQANRAMTRQDLLGKTWVADFIHTRCPDQCPMMSRQMQVIQGLLAKESSIRLVSISVNPEHDNPQVLRGYVERYHADTSRWYFLTGQREAVRRLAGSFKLTPPGKSQGDLVDHSNRLILVDAQARIRRYYDGTDDKEVQRLIKDLSALSK